MRNVFLLLVAAAFLSGAQPLYSQEEVGADNPMSRLQEAFRNAADKVENFVVSIDVERDASKPETADEEAPKPVLGREAQKRPGKYYRRPKGPVSGILISADGYIYTSWYNVRGDNIERIMVTLPDGSRLKAQRLGWDENTDIAVLKVDGKDMPHAEFTATDHLKPGHFVIVVGRGDDRLSLTVNSGIVSAVNRLEGRAIQIDAALNYGNTGGLVIDIDGKALGIACHVSDRAVTGQNSGVGFFTPQSKLAENLPLMKKGAVIPKEKKPFLGVQASDGAKDIEGAEVVRVLPNTPAAEAGMQDGDIVVEFNGSKIIDWDSLREEIAKTIVGQAVKLKVKRADKIVELDLTMGEKP